MQVMNKEFKMEKLKNIAQRMKGQDNYATRNPIYTVQKAIRIYGVEYGYDYDGSEFINSEQELYFDNLREVQEFLTSEDGREFKFNDFTEVNYKIVYETVQFFFSEEGAKQYISGQENNYRIYVISAWDNEEINTIQEILENLSEE